MNAYEATSADRQTKAFGITFKEEPKYLSGIGKAKSDFALTVPGKSRSNILEEAGACVNVDRMKTHGTPENSFGAIAGMWSAYLGVPVSSVDVTAMMALLKIARIKNSPEHADNWIDLAGYAACGGELATNAGD